MKQCCPVCEKKRVVEFMKRSEKMIINGKEQLYEDEFFICQTCGTAFDLTYGKSSTQEIVNYLRIKCG